MKKSISISIGGIIFHIEEDGYLILNEYLESIRQHFSAYPDSHEIIDDIENRIAELFFSKLTDNKQAIILEDVEELISTMGSLDDFETIEKEFGTDRDYFQNEEEQFFEEPNRLFRDESRKVLGGVLAGLAQYFQIDPLWMRLGFLILFFGFSFIPSVATVLALVYLCLIFIMPARNDFPEQKNEKKIYRDPDQKVLGGVCAGFSAFYGIDITIVRLIFIALIFLGGTAIFIYAALWVILPEAQTPSQKVKMQGQPITLENIESNIRKRLNNIEGEENIATKILLFPFRILAELLTVLQSVLGPLLTFLADIFRVFLGFITSFTGFVTLVVLLIIAVASMGWLGNDIVVGDFPLPTELITTVTSPALVVTGFFLMAIPAFYLIILGMIFFFKRSIGNRAFHITMLSLWGIAMIVGLFLIPKTVAQFKKSGSVEISEVIPYPADSLLILNLNKNKGFDWAETKLKIRGYSGDNIKVVQTLEARGKSTYEAEDNARQILYGYTVNESIISLDRFFQLDKNGKFRNQKHLTTLYLPFGLHFQMSPALGTVLRNTLSPNGYRVNQLADNEWVYTGDGLQCVTCITKEQFHYNSNVKKNQISGYYEEFEVAPFKKIEVNGSLKAEIFPSEDFEVIAIGNEEAIADCKIKSRNGTLNLSNGGLKNIFSDERIKILVGCPTIKAIEAGGSTHVIIQDFKEEESISLYANGASNIDLFGEYEEVLGNAEGASNISLKGKAKFGAFNTSGASNVKAQEFWVKNAEVTSSGASSVKLSAQEYLKAEASGSSNIFYEGNPTIDAATSGAAQVEQIGN
ncbi:PspC domain-containing protein [Persicobacter diffluens]|uniref:Phage shock protein PspC N-terminal domain-containing protein n=1 Tax=Persicobacter diffluens TaxID=981 RepID=A0AAN4VW94_9BACT|nr:hypothetical protein PEDI_14150 [Persicobacter diffluens]